MKLFAKRHCNAVAASHFCAEAEKLLRDSPSRQPRRSPIVGRSKVLDRHDQLNNLLTIFGFRASRLERRASRRVADVVEDFDSTEIEEAIKRSRIELSVTGIIIRAQHR